MSTETKDAKGGWRELQHRRRDALRAFDVEAQQLTRRMLDSIPSAIATSTSFGRQFVEAMQKAWEEWRSNPPLARADLAITVRIRVYKQGIFIRQEVESLQRAWEPYACVEARSRWLSPNDTDVRITLK